MQELDEYRRLLDVREDARADLQHQLFELETELAAARLELGEKDRARANSQRQISELEQQLSEQDWRIAAALETITSLDRQAIEGEGHPSRLFSLRYYDRYNDPNGIYRFSCPIEAVDPKTIRPGIKGVRLNE